MAGIAALLIFALEAYLVVVFIAVILRWISPGYSSNPVIRFFYMVTEPVLAPIRRRLPPVSGLDLSPMVVWVAIIILINLLRTIR